MNGRERVLAHLAGQPVDRLPLMPITMMFAADQIGVHVRRVRHATTACWSRRQLRTAEQFDFDYVSAISDPAREAADCGARHPVFRRPAAGHRSKSQALLADKTALRALKIPDPLGGGRMHDRVRGRRRCSSEQVGGEKLIEGWIEGPCAEAADLRGINTLMIDFFDDPAFRARSVRVRASRWSCASPRPRSRPALDLIGVGDAAASLVGPQIYEEFVWPYEKKLVDGLHAHGHAGAAAHLRQHAPHPRGHGPAGLRDRGPGLSWPRWPRPAPRWARTRCCWATSTRCTCCATARPSRSRRRSPSATARPGRATSSAPAARCRAIRRWRTWMPCEDMHGITGTRACRQRSSPA